MLIVPDYVCFCTPGFIVVLYDFTLRLFWIKTFPVVAVALLIKPGIGSEDDNNKSIFQNMFQIY